MTSTVPRVGITAVASSLPSREVTTADLQRRVAASLPAGVLARITGIDRRRVAADDEYASDLAIASARQVLAAADLDALDVDLLLFASATRDMAEPATAHVVQAADLVRAAPDRPVLGGTFFVLLPSLAAGAPVALPARRPRSLARQLARLEPQAAYLTPPQLRAGLAAGARFTGRVYSGSAPVSAALLAAVRAAGAHEAWGVYALTEVFPAAAVKSAAKSAFTADGDLVGELLPGVSARVDAAGQLLLAGPNAADRYLGEDPLDWIETGDVGRIAGRTVVLGGRCKDMILRGAENIYPGLYEPALHVPGVELAVIVGVPATATSGWSRWCSRRRAPTPIPYGRPFAIRCPGRVRPGRTRSCWPRSR
jgi:acyl-CoA synthetase (AMP-forming)/AMP-acid ligase II